MSIGLVFRGERFLTVSDHPLFAVSVRAAERSAPEWTDLQSAEGEKVRKVRHSGTSPFLMPSLRNRQMVSGVAERYRSKILLLSIVFKFFWVIQDSIRHNREDTMGRRQTKEVTWPGYFVALMNILPMMWFITH